VLFSPLWFWGLGREIEAAAGGAVVRGGRLDQLCLRLNLARGDVELDLALWLAAPYARAECLKPSPVRELPEAWRHLAGTTLEQVEQPHGDRRLILIFAGPRRRLELEFVAFGRAAAVLRDPSAQEPVMARAGEVRASKPPTTPFLMDLREFPKPDAASSSASLTTSLERAVRGVDRFWSHAAAAVAGLDASAPATAERIASAGRTICQWAAELRDGAPGGFVVYDGDAPVGLAQLDLGEWLPGLRFERAESLSLASSRFVYLHRRRDTALEARRALIGLAEAKLAKLADLAAGLAEDRQKQLEHATWQENADWLTAHLSSIDKGTTELEVHTANGTRTVALDPALRPARQAERWYQKARRLKRGMAATEKRLADTNAMHEELTRATADARAHEDSHDDQADLAFARLREILGATKAAAPRDRQAPSLPFRRFRSPGGLAIWVGRNNKENDELTLHHAHKHDLWFHAQQTPGSHVVLRSHALKQAPPRADILAAAAVAAFFSKARHSKKVPVIYTEARYVRKPRNAPPGQVRVEREQSIMVEPERMPAWDEE
jgi:hypothetical protein